MIKRLLVGCACITSLMASDVPTEPGTPLKNATIRRLDRMESRTPDINALVGEDYISYSDEMKVFFIKELHREALRHYKHRMERIAKKFIDSMMTNTLNKVFSPILLEENKVLRVSIHKWSHEIYKDFSYRTYKLLGKDEFYQDYFASNLYPRSFYNDLVHILLSYRKP